MQNYIVDFLNELVSYGADGFCFDSAKNIAIPREESDFFHDF